MTIGETFYAKDRKTWRAWLAKHQADRKEIWLVFYKKHTGHPSVTYEEAVQEAICFGWIDSILQKMDEERYAQKFTPRGAKTKWSATNVRRAEKMIKTGRMTEAGLAKYRGAKPYESPTAKAAPTLPAELMGVLQANGRACENFFKLAPSARRLYVGWILEGKKEETRLRRLREAIDLLAAGRKLGMK
ncbi:MAG: YdeI/OmpD-associated family protein [Candidatus Aminicenantes bacterium]|nr:YdeI/OmpD-associated family protein [Candidatus Aminicenantes bacterium]